MFITLALLFICTGPFKTGVGVTDARGALADAMGAKICSVTKRCLSGGSEYSEQCDASGKGCHSGRRQRFLAKLRFSIYHLLFQKEGEKTA